MVGDKPVAGDKLEVIHAAKNLGRAVPSPVLHSDYVFCVAPGFFSSLTPSLWGRGLRRCADDVDWEA